jgi:hypothetical protein
LNHFSKLVSENHPLQNLFVRKNLIVGYLIQDFAESLRVNNTLKVIDFEENLIDNECTLKLIEAVKEGYNIEEIILKHNSSINKYYLDTL